MGSEIEQELDDRWWLGLRGRTVEAVLDHRFTVLVRFEGRASLTIEAEAHFKRSADERMYPAVIRNGDGTLSATGELVELVGRRVMSAVAFKTGQLRLAFESARQLTVAPGEQFESWQFTGPSGRLWVSMPGGGLSTFPASTQIS